MIIGFILLLSEIGQTLYCHNTFICSVVIPIYNTARYLPDTVSSIMAQTLGFKDNIQIILINDGSTDNTDAICLKYVNEYPDNIVYLNQSHQGVSHARNSGIPYIRGRYVNFLDSDDCWEHNALKEMVQFFESHYHSIDIVAGRIKHFENQNKFHILDDKFSSTRIINLEEDYSLVQLSASSSLIKAEAIQKELRFSTLLDFAEDALFINTLLLTKRCYGVVREALYLYRTRNDRSSKLQSSITAKNYYYSTPQFFCQDLMSLAQSRYGTVPRFIQYAVLYHLQFLIMSPAQPILSTDEVRFIRAVVVNILQNVEDRIIIEQRFMPVYLKYLCLKEKYSTDVEQFLIFKDTGISFQNHSFASLPKLKCKFLIRDSTVEIFWIDRICLPLKTWNLVIGKRHWYPDLSASPIKRSPSLLGAIVLEQKVTFTIPSRQILHKPFQFFLGRSALPSEVFFHNASEHTICCNCFVDMTEHGIVIDNLTSPSEKQVSVRLYQLFRLSVLLLVSISTLTKLIRLINITL